MAWAWGSRRRPCTIETSGFTPRQPTFGGLARTSLQPDYNPFSPIDHWPVAHRRDLPRAGELTTIWSFFRPDVDLTGSRDLLLLVEQHLLPLREPTGHATDREQHGEEISRERHRAINEPGIKVDVRVKLA